MRCGLLVISFLLVGNVAVLADPVSATPTCDALTSVAGNLYLVDASGSPLAQFTSDGVTRDGATVAPDGHRVAWLAAGPHDQSYVVRDAAGHQASFDPHATDQKDDVEAAGPLMAVTWSSDDVLQLEKHEGPLGSRFEYHQAAAGGSSAPVVGEAGAGVACARHSDVACVQDGEIQVNGAAVFDQWPDPGKKEASVTVRKGAIGTLPGTPAFTVQVLDISGNTIGLQVTNPNGIWSKEWVPRGVPLAVDWKFVSYGFTATLVDQKTGSVRVDEFVGDDDDRSRPPAFGPAITWSPDGHDLLAVYRSDDQATLYWVRPDSGAQANSGAKGPWTLAARAPLSITSTIKSMRFISPSMLLLQTEDGDFEQLPVTITQGQSGQTAALALGAPTTLPQTLQVKLKPSPAPAVPGDVIDWACGLPRGQ